MKNIVKQPVTGISLAILSLTLLSGCASFSATKTADLPSKAKILVMPPHDVVQGGRPHTVGIGSGRQLQKTVQRVLNLKSDYEIVVFEPNEQFNHTTIINREDAIAEAQKSGADYCLLLTLGEFRNAAPMTFRSDFVTLESGFLIDVHTKKEVWSLTSPYRLDSLTNLGNHYGLIDDIAKAVAESIVKQ